MNWDIPSANDYDYARFIREKRDTYAGDDILYVVPFYAYGATASEECLINSNYDTAVNIFSAYGLENDCQDMFTYRGYLVVYLYRGENGDRYPENGFTDAALVAFTILDSLAEYPLLDESDFSNREYAMWESVFSDELRYASRDYENDSESDIEAISEIAFTIYSESDYASFSPDDVGDVSDIYRDARDKYFNARAHDHFTAQINGQGEFDV